ncbi:MAG: cytidylate kinase-like family protein [Nitrospirae bacterium]|nr:cytidylate kinase-like family protein [Nitrospirota bacterium]
MPIITLTRSSFSHGREIAQKTAEMMGYEVIGNEVIETASKEYNVPVAKLTGALERAPSLFGMSVETRRKYIAYFQAVMARYMLKDKLVYDGPAAHVLIQGVSHILKVCIVANIDDRTKLRAEEEKISEKEALKRLLKEDKEHKEWAKTFYNVDDSDPSLYDIVLNLGQLSVDDAVKIIASMASNKKFQPMTYSIKCISNIELACKIKAALIDLDPDVNVRADGGNVFIHTRTIEKEKDKRVAAIKDIASKFNDVRDVEVQVTEDFFKQVSSTLR